MAVRIGRAKRGQGQLVGQPFHARLGLGKQPVIRAFFFRICIPKRVRVRASGFVFTPQTIFFIAPVVGNLSRGAGEVVLFSVVAKGRCITIQQAARGAGEFTRARASAGKFLQDRGRFPFDVGRHLVSAARWLRTVRATPVVVGSGQFAFAFVSQAIVVVAEAI